MNHFVYQNRNMYNHTPHQIHQTQGNMYLSNNGIQQSHNKKGYL